RALSEINPYLLSLDRELAKEATKVERRFILEEPHLVRGDSSDYMLRSSQSRITHRGEYFAPHNTHTIQRGDILIDNSLYTKYAGEAQIALLQMENVGKTNVVGRVLERDLPLLDMLKAWQKFKFIDKTNN
ncbi:phospho-sugar glycosidase domain-containing protein, partial [Bacteroides sp. MSSM.1001136sp1_RTP21357st2_E1_RTP21359_211015]|uniref:phospho-sugar glycosidase domain-containing protein n=1 Tax=Bacteroides sp. MSSM.1001136sp1_RTP21357st2_E1_RTP21359_211015 TaxID=3141587 RepID=UPI0034A5C975